MSGFKVRHASTLVILAAVFFAASTVLGLLAAAVALQPGQLAAGDWVWLGAAASVFAGTAAALLLIAFAKLCTNVEFLVRSVLDRHSAG